MRVRKVQDLRFEGLSYKEIAEYLGVSERTVFYDLEASKALNREAVLTLDHDSTLGERLQNLERIRTKALQDYHLCPENGNNKVGFLNTALRAEEKITQLLQDVGLIVNVPERIMLEEGMDFSDPEIRREYLALLKKARTRGEKNLGL